MPCHMRASAQSRNEGAQESTYLVAEGEGSWRTGSELKNSDDDWEDGRVWTPGIEDPEAMIEEEMGSEAGAK